ncbi:hypothetical protein JCM10369A_18410 [Nocardioides pyridinolyticus]
MPNPATWVTPSAISWRASREGASDQLAEPLVVAGPGALCDIDPRLGGGSPTYVGDFEHDLNPSYPREIPFAPRGRDWDASHTAP